jgi:hypothetical protein
MKKLISIPLLVLILFSGINIDIASHFCGGRLVATKISLTGEPASCGMEDHPVLNMPNGSITTHCCDNVISSFTMGLNYVPSLSTSVPDNGPDSNHLYIVPCDIYKSQENILSYQSYIRRPPGVFNPNDVDQQSICIYRI